MGERSAKVGDKGKGKMVTDQHDEMEGEEEVEEAETDASEDYVSGGGGDGCMRREIMRCSSLHKIRTNMYLYNFRSTRMIEPTLQDALAEFLRSY